MLLRKLKRSNHGTKDEQPLEESEREAGRLEAALPPGDGGGGLAWASP